MFDKLSDFLQKHIMPIANKLSANKELTAVRDGMVVAVPATIFGAIALILTNIPYLDKVAPGVQNWLSNFFSQANPITIGMIALLVLIGMANSYAGQLKENKIYGVIVAITSFLAITIFSNTGDSMVKGKVVHNVVTENVIPTSVFSSSGVFTVIIVTLISIRLYHFFTLKHWTIRMPDAVPPNVSQSFASLLPMTLTLLFFIIVRNLFLLTPFQSFQNFIYQIFTTPLLKVGDSVWAVLFFILVQQVLWFFGIHGTNVVMSVWSPILLTMMTANLDAYNAGKALPYIVSQTFWQVYSEPFILCIPVLLLFCKSVQAKAMGKMSIIPAMFCINEPFLFGLPVILNPILFIPWIFAYILQFLLMYGLAVIHWIPIPVVPVPWTTPPIISGLLATNFNIMGAVAQILSFLLGLALWYPFMKILDKSMLAKEKKDAEDKEAAEASEDADTAAPAGQD
ncbi:PTS sugar transporter subunit IIC [Lacticaseibacillus hegangensis]|uniref:Permease IIC component n=1 Tax=Lacticaseibacillus hegangensis TaxID=2486010 RepID=A0ABW4CYK2_9LACO|nr:PTS transporter subunit EIIC [Lacticaseibacillus hegangensis]